jgi:hypothetical protein
MIFEKLPFRYVEADPNGPGHSPVCGTNRIRPDFSVNHRTLFTAKNLLDNRRFPGAEHKAHRAVGAALGPFLNEFVTWPPIEMLKLQSKEPQKSPIGPHDPIVSGNNGDRICNFSENFAPTDRLDRFT